MNFLSTNQKHQHNQGGSYETNSLSLSLSLSLVALMLLACERNSATLTDSLEGTDAQLTANHVAGSTVTESTSAEFEFQAIVADYDFDFDCSSSCELAIQFVTNSNNVFDLSVPVTVSPSFDAAQPGDMQYDVIESMTERIPTNLSYDGTSITYAVNGQNESEFLNSDEKQILDWVQNGLNQAETNFENCILFPCEASVNNDDAGMSMTATGEEKSFQTMNNQELKSWLEDKGYEVKHLEGKRFEITRNYGQESRISGSFSATHVFDAATGKIEQRSSAKDNGIKIADTMTSKQGSSSDVHSLIMERAE